MRFPNFRRGIFTTYFERDAEFSSRTGVPLEHRCLNTRTRDLCYSKSIYSYLKGCVMVLLQNCNQVLEYVYLIENNQLADQH